MKAHHTRILLVEDDPVDARLVRALLSHGACRDFEFDHVTRIADATARMDKHAYDAALVDLDLPDSSGLDTLSTLRWQDDELPLVVYTGCGDETIRDQALAHGAADWLDKNGMDARRLAHSVEAAVEHSRLRHALQQARSEKRDSMVQIFDLLLAAEDAALVVSARRTVLFANAGAEKLLGTPKQRLLGQALDTKVGNSIMKIMGVRARARWVSTTWNGQPAQVVLLHPPDEPTSAPAVVDPALPGIASDLREHLVRVGGVVGSVRRRLTEVEALLGRRMLARRRQQIGNVLHDAVDMLDSGVRELDSASRGASTIVRETNQLACGACEELDATLLRLLPLLETRMPAMFTLELHRGAPWFIVADTRHLESLVDGIMFGIGRILGATCREGGQIHLRTRPAGHSALLVVNLWPSTPSPDIARRLLHAIASGSGIADPLGAASPHLRALGMQTRLGTGHEHDAWVELMFPCTN